MRGRKGKVFLLAWPGLDFSHLPQSLPTMVTAQVRKEERSNCQRGSATGVCSFSQAAGLVGALGQSPGAEHHVPTTDTVRSSTWCSEDVSEDISGRGHLQPTERVQL